MRTTAEKGRTKMMRTAEICIQGVCTSIQVHPPWDMEEGKDLRIEDGTLYL